MKKYIDFLENLKVNKGKLGVAPHKPILLLSVFDGIEQNKIKSEKIYITPELVANFKDNWDLLVTTKHNSRFAYPFFHLKNEKSNFWRLIPNIGYEKILLKIDNSPSLKTLDTVVEYAEIDKELFLLFSKKESRNELRNILLATCFSETRNKYSNKKITEDNYLKFIEDNIISDTSDNLSNQKKRKDG